MPLRLVNAVFFEAKQRFIVVYQNGSLWQLPRMKIDLVSWRNRKSYKGLKNNLYLLRNQKISDQKLSKIVPTQEFPTNLTNINLPKFESWWRTNGYEWLKNKEKEALATATKNLATDGSMTGSITQKTQSNLNINTPAPVKRGLNVNARNTQSNQAHRGNTINTANHHVSSQTNNINTTKTTNNSTPKTELSFLAKRHIAKQKELEEQRSQHNHLAIKRTTMPNTTDNKSEIQHKKINRETLQANRKIHTRHANTAMNPIHRPPPESSTNHSQLTNKVVTETSSIPIKVGNKPDTDIFDSFLTDLDT